MLCFVNVWPLAASTLHSNRYKDTMASVRSIPQRFGCTGIASVNDKRKKTWPRPTCLEHCFVCTGLWGNFSPTLACVVVPRDSLRFPKTGNTTLQASLSGHAWTLEWRRGVFCLFVARFCVRRLRLWGYRNFELLILYLCLDSSRKRNKNVYSVAHISGCGTDHNTLRRETLKDHMFPTGLFNSRTLF